MVVIHNGFRQNGSVLYGSTCNSSIYVCYYFPIIINKAARKTENVGTVGQKYNAVCRNATSYTVGLLAKRM